MMGKEPLVSVIIPVYNVYDYIERCFQSIRAQTYENIEIVLVDDGSTDGSGEKCDEFASSYCKSVVIHQENAGLSVARNNGVKASSGEFITFVDSDDYIDNCYVDYLIKLMLTYDADVSIGKTRLVYEGTTERKEDKNTSIEILSSQEAISRMCYSNGFSVSAWAKMYKRCLVEKYPYPPGKLYEDLATTYKIFGDSNRIVYGSKTIYYWFQRDTGITFGKINDNQLYAIDAAKQQLEFIKKNYPDIVEAGEARCASKIIDLVPKTLNKGGMDYFHTLRTEIAPYFSSVLFNKNVRMTVKIRCLALKMGYIPSCLIFTAHRFMKVYLLKRR